MLAPRSRHLMKVMSGHEGGGENDLNESVEKGIGSLLPRWLR